MAEIRVPSLQEENLSHKTKSVIIPNSLPFSSVHTTVGNYETGCKVYTQPCANSIILSGRTTRKGDNPP